MKLVREFKLILFSLLGVLYLTGALSWCLGLWLQIDRGMGPEPSPWRLTSIHTHGIAGLGFLIAFGYLIHAHIRPGLRGGRKKRTGGALLAVLLLLIGTAPVLLYAGNDTVKSWTSFVHTYLGLGVALPFFFHLMRRAPR